MVFHEGDLSKAVVSDEAEVNMGHIAFVTSKASLIKEVVFHEGGLSKEVLLYVCTHYTSTSVYGYICTYVHMLSCTCTHMHTCAYSMYVHTYIRTYICDPYRKVAFCSKYTHSDSDESTGGCTLEVSLKIVGNTLLKTTHSRNAR